MILPQVDDDTLWDILIKYEITGSWWVWLVPSRRGARYVMWKIGRKLRRVERYNAGKVKYGI